MPMDYAQYQEEVTADVAKIIADASCQPILFIGSGFSKRYAAGPNWEELLMLLAERCPKIDKDFAYYKQAYGNDLMKIGSIFTQLYHEWAWNEGKKNFPPEYFIANVPSDIFIKHTIGQVLAGIGVDENGSYGSLELDAEIAALKAISAHAVVTTNYDEVIEPLFPGYERVISQQILRKPFLAIGEIFKIHGCVSLPESIVINEEDYIRFEEDHKYLSAKLLTYFIEHPLIFIGYRAGDPNIKKILADVDRMIRAQEYELVPNIYILEWDKNLTDKSYPPRDKVLAVTNDRNIRIKSITANSFEWVFKAFGQAGNLSKIDTKLLRALMARAVDLVRSDIPKKQVEIDFKMLEHAVDTGENFANLFGVTSVGDSSKINLTHQYVITEVYKKLGLPSWKRVNDLIKIIENDTGVNIKSYDNKYHVNVKFGVAKTSKSHKYSDMFIDLLKKVMAGQPYKIDEDAIIVPTPIK
ncbi:SIR2 family protein [Comamonas sp. MYb21]|uniref:SIR2 family NAD-dependent protein deacylase n=1 Tax=Comamonas sp. MYb21 TaxID=1848648 RepID=UPI0030ADA62C